MSDTNTQIDSNFRDLQQGTSRADRVRETQRRFVLAEEHYASELVEIQKAFDAYVDVDEWPSEAKQKREIAKKPVNDVARFTNVVDVISGNQIQSRTQGYAFPLQKDDMMTADFLNLYMRYRRQKQDLDSQDSDIFRNGALSTRAHVEFFLKPNAKDGSLDVIRKERPPQEVFVETPFREYDASDSPGMFHAQWVSLDALKAMFDISEEDEQLLQMRNQAQGPVGVETTHQQDEYLFKSDTMPTSFFDSEKQQVRLIRHWSKWHKKVYRVVNLINPQSIEDATIGEFGSRGDAVTAAAAFLREARQEVNEDAVDALIDTEQREMYSLHVLSGRLELAWTKEWGEFIPFRHFFGYWVDGRPSGLWKRTKDEIISINYLWNKLIERLGKVGWNPIMMEDGALSEGTNKQAALDSWRDGGIVWLSSGAIAKSKVKVERDHSLQAIGPYIGIVEYLTQNLEQKTGTNDAFQGVSPGANTAGIAIERLQQRGAAVVEPLFDSFRRFQKLCDLMEVAMLSRAYGQRPLYTELKMEKIVGGMVQEATDEKVLKFMSALEAGTNGSADVSIARILESLDQIEYDIRIDRTVSTPSLRIASLQAMSQLAGAAGLPIPPEVAVEMFDFLPQRVKQKWLSSLQRMEVPAAGQQGQNGQTGPADNQLNPNNQTL